jgi:CDP-diacylglycerol---glycerol-3-phosphate 3-phosphatidyltransferase
MERLPNWLTWARLAAVPIVMALLAIDDGQEGAARWCALAVFFLACMTDFLDGYLARRWHVITRFGKLADPIADKALVIGTLFMLCLLDEHPVVPWWPLIVIAIREVAVTVGRLRVASHVVIPASRGGKVKTMVQLFAIGFYLIPNMPAWVDTLAWWLLLAAVILSVATWIDYEMRLSRARKESANAA